MRFGLVCFALIFGVACFASPSDGAQRNGVRSAAQRNRIAGGSTTEEREARFRQLLRGPGNANTPEVSEQQQQLAWKEICRDFEAIQVLRDGLIESAGTDGEQAVARVLGLNKEMSRRARRLWANLALPDVRDGTLDRDAGILASSDALKAAVLQLGRHITSFVTNPIFQNLSLVDVDLASNASRDLQAIIRLTENLKRSVGRLKKNL